MYTSYYGPSYSSAPVATAAGAGVVAGIGVFFLVLIAIAWAVLVIIAKWKIFAKAGKDGWKSLIPVY